MERHDIVIDFLGKEALIRHFPEEKYCPEFLGQDACNLFYYLDSIEEPLPDYSPRMAGSDENGNIYLILSPSKKHDSACGTIVEKLLEVDSNFSNFYGANFKKFSLFIGEDGYEMEPAKIIKSPEIITENRALRFSFQWEGIKGTLSLPASPGAVPVAEIKKKWDFEKRELSEIAIRNAKSPL